MSALQQISDDRLVEEAGVNGLKRMLEIVHLDGSLSMHGQELLDELGALGFAEEWSDVVGEVNREYGFLGHDEDDSEVCRRALRNREFLLEVAKKMGFQLDPVTAVISCKAA
jgi:hypothetical protein